MALEEQDFVVLGDKDVEDFNTAGLLPLSTEEIQKIQKWLQPTDFNSESSEYNKHLGSYAHGTGKWIQESEQYQQWMHSSDYGALWIKAVPGAGKSVVAAHLASQLGDEERVPVVHFFFRQIITTNKTPQSLVRDWMSQLLSCSPLLQSKLKDLLENSRTLETVAFTELWDILEAALSAIPRVYCIADALDEMDMGNELFMHQLIQLGRQWPGSVKVLMTSRPLPRIEKVLKDKSVLQIPLRLPLVDHDIGIYITSRLRAVDMPQDAKTAIQQTLRSKSQGLFLYARLMMDDLCESGKLNIKSIDGTLDKLPSGLSDMYTMMLLDHSARSGVPQELQLLILQSVIHSSRPLRLLEIATIIDFMRKTTNPDLVVQANTIPQDTKSIVRAGCGPLLEIMEDETVSVIHHSFTEFLIDPERKHTGVDQFPAIDFAATHRNLATICLNYLLSDWFNDWDNLPEHRPTNTSLSMKYPFLSYAIAHWHYHILKYDEPDAEISLKLDTLMEPGSKVFLAYLHWIGKDSRVDKVSAIHVASSKGLNHYVSYLLELGEDIDVLDGKSRTPLHRAAQKGHHKVVKVLLNHGAANNMDDYTGLTPLHHAASRDHSKVVEILLESGVDPCTPKTREDPGRRCGNAPITTGQTPVQLACSFGHSETVRKFTSFLDSEKLSQALFYAASSGKPEVVLAILETPMIQVNKIIAGVTPLHLAAHVHDLQSMRKLLSMGADPNIKCKTSSLVRRGSRGIRQGESSTLHLYAAGFRASRRNSIEEELDGFKLLLSAGCDVNEFDSYGETPLHQVLGDSGNGFDAHTCSPQILTFLLENGADPLASTKKGSTPLSLIKGDAADVLELLIAKGCDVNARNLADGRTPLFTALQQNCYGNFIALIKHGANCNVQDKEGDTPLHIAVCNSRTAFWKSSQICALLKHGADPNLRNQKGETPLHVMRNSEPLYVMRNSERPYGVLSTLLTSKPDLEAKADDGQTVLMRHVKNQQVEIIKELIEAGAKLDACDFNGQTALHLACERAESSPLIRVLVKAGADPNQRDFAGNTILHQAARQSHSHNPVEQLELLGTILELGVPPASRNNLGQTPFHIAAGMLHSRESSSPIFEFLLGPKCNLDVNEADYRGVRPIHLAATLSETHVAKLLDKGANPLAITHEGQSVLQIAARARRSNVVGLIIDLYSKLGQKKLVNHVDKEGRTALHYACRSGRFESVKILLDAGAEVNVKDSKFRTPLHMCVEFREEVFHWSSRQLTGQHRPYIDAASVTLEDPFRPPGEPSQGYPAPGVGTLAANLGSRICSENQTVGVRQIIRSLVAHGADAQFMFRMGVAKILHDPISIFEEALASDCEVMVDELLNIAESGAIEDHTTDEYLKERGYVQRNHFVEKYVPLRLKTAPGLLDDSLKMYGTCFPVLHALLVTENERGVEELARLGVDMIKPGQSGESCLTVLAKWGYASTLEKVGAQASLVNESWIKEMGKTDSYGPGYLRPILHTACYRELPNIEVVKVLVGKLGVDVNCRFDENDYEQNGCTALHILAQSQHWWKSYAMEYLIEKGADMELKDDCGATALHVAVQHRARRSIEVLLERGANPSALDSNNISCLNKAESDSTIVHQLIKYGADISCGKKPFIFNAIAAMDLATVDLLIEMGADCNIRPEQESEEESTDEEAHLQQWRNATVDITANSYPVHFAACMKFHSVESRSKIIQIIKSLLRGGANPLLPFNKDGDLVLHDVCENMGIIEPFLGVPNIDLETRDFKGRTLLLAACSPSFRNVHYRALGAWQYAGPSAEEILLENGADVTALDNQGRNILHYLLPNCATGYRPFFELVLSKLSGLTSVIQKDASGWTPLHYALKHRALWAHSITSQPNWGASENSRSTNPLLFSLLEKFLSFGVDINASNSMGQTPLFQYFAEEAAVLLHLGSFVEAGADFKARDATGQGLLHVVAKRNPKVAMDRFRFTQSKRNADAVIFETLMEKGLDPMAEDMKQRTALDVAAAAQNTAILELFKRTK